MEGRMDGRTDENYFTPFATHLTLPLAHERTDGGTDGRTGNILHLFPPTSPSHLPTHGGTDEEYFTPIATHLTLPLAHGRTDEGTDGRIDEEYFTALRERVD